MDLSTSLSTTERGLVQAQTDAFNRVIAQQGGASQELGRDDFLRILLTQLQNQDPTQPMEDKEFISQMAQFSALEQMTNVSQGFQEMNALLSTNQALSVLGRVVEVRSGEQVVTGTVSSVTSGAMPQISVNDQTFDYSDLVRVIN
ncbi:MAG: flagellar hook assembly protein FlgD [Spirochaetales bacterium]|nr:flagellar hook assembly protein FlgD [Spirochaetales bacterium]